MTDILERIRDTLRRLGEAGIFEILLTPGEPAAALGPATGLRHERRPDLVPTPDEIAALREAASARPDLNDGLHRWRITTTAAYGGAAAVALRKIGIAPSLNEYGPAGAVLRTVARREPSPPLTPTDLETLEFGLFAITGPVGAGKTGLLCALLHETAETGNPVLYVDPAVEYDLARRTAGPIVWERTDLLATPPERLTAFRLWGLRDVFVGEVASPEEIRRAVELAAAGFRVWTTLHAATPGAAFLRCLRADPGAEGVLRIIAAVRLLPHARDARRVVPICGAYFAAEVDFTTTTIRTPAGIRLSVPLETSLAEAVARGDVRPEDAGERNVLYHDIRDVVPSP
jgi:hypothetical protein